MIISPRRICWFAAAFVAVCGSAHAAPLALVISSDDGDRLYQIDLASGTTVSRGDLPTTYEDIEGLALSSAGQLFGIDDATKTLLRIDANTASVVLPGGSRANTGLAAGGANNLDPGLAFACDGRLLLSTTRGKLYEVSTTTGLATAIGGTAATMATDITDITARGPDVYGLGYTGLYRINPGNATSTLIGPYGSGIQFSEGGGMAFDQSGNLWAIADRSVNNGPSQIFRIDAATGKATAAGSTSIRGIESLAIQPTDCTPTVMGTPSIPVPAATHNGLLLGVLMLAGLGLLQLRRR